MKRQQTLNAARKAVGSRHRRYGTPTANFEAIARLWGAHLTTKLGTPVEITPTDVALMFVYTKGARLQHDQAHADSWIDIAGYAACGAEAAEAK
ncbi:MAG: hypothetical protein ISS15_05515 [Alphaproteobacteria bacterium]|nr:hypothetical protein [Alphaproteobacteria bacterium]MBL7097098.1 hypothetical protein [Alphaproteobacteria bacterium]